MKIINASQLKLADIVRPLNVAPGGYNTATVKQIKDGYVTLFRPYVHTDNFSYTGGVICYTGIEEYKVAVDGTWHEFELIESRELK